MRKILLVAVLCLMGVLAAVAQENTASVNIQTIRDKHLVKYNFS